MLGDTCMIFFTQRGETYTILCMLCNDAFKSLRCVADQSISPALLFVTPWTTAHQAPLSFTISQSLLKFISTELVVPSNHLILFLAFNSFQHHGLFQWVSSLHQVAKVLDLWLGSSLILWLWDKLIAFPPPPAGAETWLLLTYGR